MIHQFVPGLKQVHNRSAWVVRGDRRISWSEKPKPDNPIVEGKWWEPGIEDELFISMDSRAAYDLGMKTMMDDCKEGVMIEGLKLLAITFIPLAFGCL